MLAGAGPGGDVVEEPGETGLVDGELPWTPANGLLTPSHKLCRRAIEPMHGKWTLPAGYLENGETVAQGAQRETLEEAGARIEIIAPYALFNISYVSQIYVMFRARMIDGHIEAGSESSDVRFFSESEIPWDEIAFTVIEATLRQYFKDKPAGLFPFHMGDILPKTRDNAGEY